MDPKSLFTLLLEFMEEKSQMLLNQNALLMSRYIRFCRASNDIPLFLNLLKSQQKELQSEFMDTVGRIERLNSIVLQKNEQIRLEIKKQEAVQINEERAGVLRSLETLQKRENEIKTLKEQDVGIEYELSDLVLFLRWLIVKSKSVRDLNVYYARAKVGYFYFNKKYNLYLFYRY